MTDQVENLKKAYPEVYANYPEMFDTSKWLGFEITMGVMDHTIGDLTYKLVSPVTYVEASPNNGTRYRFHIINPLLGDQEVVPGMPEGCFMIAMDPGHYSWKRTCYLRRWDVHPSYLMEKLGMGEVDAVAMCLILGHFYEANT